MNNFGMKELYEVSLKTTYPVEMGGRKIEAGETIAVFDRIQISSLDEHTSTTAARGGYNNQAWVWWEETQDVTLQLSQGVFSQEHLALMSNSKLITNDGTKTLEISKREVLETDEVGACTLLHAPSGNVFVYDRATGEKLDARYEGNRIYTSNSYRDVIIDYNYLYSDKYNTLTIGQQLTNGFLSLEGKIRVKNDTNGQVTTGIIKIPKLQLMSTLSMRLGQSAAPMVGSLRAVAVPVGVRGQKKVMEIIFLDDDIDSDI